MEVGATSKLSIVDIVSILLSDYIYRFHTDAMLINATDTGDFAGKIK